MLSAVLSTGHRRHLNKSATNSMKIDWKLEVLLRISVHRRIWSQPFELTDEFHTFVKAWSCIVAFAIGKISAAVLWTNEITFVQVCIVFEIASDACAVRIIRFSRGLCWACWFHTWIRLHIVRGTVSTFAIRVNSFADRWTHQFTPVANMAVVGVIFTFAITFWIISNGVVRASGLRPNKTNTCKQNTN